MMLPEATQAHLGWLRTRLARLRGRRASPPSRRAVAPVHGLRDRAPSAQRWFLRELAAVLERYDLLVHPEMPVLPPPIGEETVVLRGERMPYRLALIPFNSPWSTRRLACGQRALRVCRRAARGAGDRRPARCRRNGSSRCGCIPDARPTGTNVGRTRRAGARPRSRRDPPLHPARGVSVLRSSRAAQAQRSCSSAAAARLP